MEKDVKADSHQSFYAIVGVLIFWGLAVWLNTVITRRSLRLQEVQAHNAELAARLSHLTHQCESLAATKEALKRDPVIVEREIRTVFGMIRPGEQTYTPINVSIRQMEQRQQLAQCGIEDRLNRVLRLWRTDPVSFRYYSLAVLFTAMAVVLVMPMLRASKGCPVPVEEWRSETR